MKKLLLTSLILSIYSCGTDVYTGEEYYIVQGKLVNNAQQPIIGKKVYVENNYILNVPGADQFKLIEIKHSVALDRLINETTTDDNGVFYFAVPKYNDNSNNYTISFGYDKSNTKQYGYFSPSRSSNYQINLGTVVYENQ